MCGGAPNCAVSHTKDDSKIGSRVAVSAWFRWHEYCKLPGWDAEVTQYRADNKYAKGPAMTERELQELLNTTDDFLQRQRLLKQLWHIQRQRDLDAKTSGSAQERQLLRPLQRVASRRPKTLVA